MTGVKKISCSIYYPHISTQNCVKFTKMCMPFQIFINKYSEIFDGFDTFNC